jgi:ankyrin repeat protein
LDIAYKDAIERIQAQPAGLRDVAQQVISWIVNAKRRLTTGELQEALAIEPGSKSLDNDNFTEIEDMVNSCAGLVTIDDESHIIRLVHYTTEEYFQKHLGDWIPDAPRRIAVACLTYLTLDTFATGACDTDKEFEARVASNVLLDYASSHWADHLIDSGTDVNDLALQFLLEGPLVQSAAQALFVRKYRYSGYSQEYPKKATGLHLAAERGHEAVVKLLLARSDINVNASDVRGETPLLYAAERGHKAVVKLLLAQSDINVNASDNLGRTPLMNAAKGGHEAAVKLLLAQSNINVNASDANGWRPLFFAAMEGHEAVANLLLARSDVDVNASDCIWQTPLFYAATGGHEAVVKRLLAQSNINVNASDKYGETPLLYAAERGHEAVVKLLLAQSDIDVNASNEYGRTPLSFAAEGGRGAVVKLLLSRSDVDVNVRDTRTGRTAWSYAAWRGHEAVVRLFESQQISNRGA